MTDHPERPGAREADADLERQAEVHRARLRSEPCDKPTRHGDPCIWPKGHGHIGPPRERWRLIRRRSGHRAGEPYTVTTTDGTRAYGYGRGDTIERFVDIETRPHVETTRERWRLSRRETNMYGPRGSVWAFDHPDGRNYGYERVDDEPNEAWLIVQTRPHVPSPPEPVRFFPDEVIDWASRERPSIWCGPL